MWGVSCILHRWVLCAYGPGPDGWVGGFGVYCPQLRIKHAMPNPEGERQTNNAAELFAVL